VLCTARANVDGMCFECLSLTNWRSALLKFGPTRIKPGDYQRLWCGSGCKIDKLLGLQRMTSAKLKYDIIIVGAGPAGTVTALYAARYGLRTLLLDKSRFPRDKVCGDGITGRAISILRDLGLEAAVDNLPGVRFRKMLFGSARHIEAEIDLNCARNRELVTGYVIRRQVFDNFLLNRARAVGTTCVEGFTVDELVWENGKVCGVVGHDSGSGARREYRGCIVVGADGYRSIVARKVGTYAIHPAHWIVAIRRYYRNVARVSDCIELHYVSAVTPGYFWIFPLDNGLANVGIGMLSSAMKKKRVHLTQALDQTIRDEFFAPRFADAVPAEKPVGWHLPVGSTHRPCCGPGYLLVGDAAGLIDPFTGEGIANAMYSGRLAAQAAAMALRTGEAGAANLEHFDVALWDELGQELRLSTRLQKIARLEWLLNFTIRKAARSQEVRDTLCAMIAHEESREQMTSPLFYLRLLLK
jgi:geranylgeranyl reductase family protein